MKTSKLILLLTAFCSMSYGQLLKTGNTWNYLEVTIPICEKSTQCEGRFFTNYNYQIGGDTLINNKLYTKVIETAFRNNVSTPVDYNTGFLRDAENHKKIYRQLSYMDDTTEVLLYDFTIKKDSIFKSTYEELYHLPSGDNRVKSTYYSAQVLDIDSVVFYGTKRLRIKLLDFRINWITNSTDKDTVEWIEGIGSNKGLLDYAHGDYNLLCFKQDEELRYMIDYGFDCNYTGPISNIEDQEFEKISIYPNPLKDSPLHVVSADLISSIHIFDMTGELVEQYFPENTHYQLHLNHLKCGFYIIQADQYFFKLIIE
jgi:hypothetical protein